MALLHSEIFLWRVILLLHSLSIVKYSEAETTNKLRQENYLINLLVKDELNANLFVQSKSICTSDSKIGFELGTDWMSLIPDDQMLSGINIPGTHDTGARFGIEHKCQKLNLSEQLEVGIRSLDIRCRHINNSFFIYHGEFYQHLTFSDVQNITIEFLKNHPSESIIMSIAEEYKPEGDTRNFSQTFEAYIQNTTNYWLLDNVIPFIGSSRGKILLVRRFFSPTTMGINATNWPDDQVFNTTFRSFPSQFLLIEDVYKAKTVDEKFTLAIEHLITALYETNPNNYFLTYLSVAFHFEFEFPYLMDPLYFADKINPLVYQFLENFPLGRWGTVLMDFPTNDLINQIICSNAI